MKQLTISNERQENIDRSNYLSGTLQIIADPDIIKSIWVSKETTKVNESEIIKYYNKQEYLQEIESTNIKPNQGEIKEESKIVLVKANDIYYGLV